jgi:hypothetical protein
MLVLCNISLIEEFRVYFGPDRGARREHSRGSVTDEQRRAGPKEAVIIDMNLCYRALAARSHLLSLAKDHLFR